MAIPKNGKKKKSLLKSSKEVKTAQNNSSEVLKGLQDDLQLLEAEIEQGVSGVRNLEMIQDIRKRIRKIKKLAG